MQLSFPTHSIAIVTGASRQRGIGAAVCRALAAAGCDIFFTHWRAYDHTMPWGAEQDTPDHLQQQLQAMGIRCTHIEADLATPDAPRLIMDAVEERLGPPTILVNNATHSEMDIPFDQLTARILDAHYAVNIRGTILLSIEFARRFQRPSGGRIISLTSGQGLGPMPGELAYVATKGAIEAFTLTLSAEIAARGITVNAVDPGVTDTGWMSDEIKQALLARSPHKRLGQPEDAARLITFLASTEGAWITGQVIRSRGGS